jgi:hypothetical protein
MSPSPRLNGFLFTNVAHFVFTPLANGQGFS